MPSYSAKMFSGGRVTIPKKMRDELAFNPGSSVYFLMDNTGAVYMSTSREALERPLGEDVGTDVASALSTAAVVKLISNAQSEPSC